VRSFVRESADGTGRPQTAVGIPSSFAVRLIRLAAMSQRTKDLFDDSVMTFGEHLEALRSHLIKAILGIAIAMMVCLYYGDVIVAIVRRPLDQALQRYGRDFGQDQVDPDQVDQEAKEIRTGWKWFLHATGLDTLTGSDTPEPPEKEKQKVADPNPEEAPQNERSDSLTVQISAGQVAGELHRIDPQFPEPGPSLKDRNISVTLNSPFFREQRAVALMAQRPVTLNVQEGFMVYLKLSGFGGLILASPWVFYQLWMFVAAGLYPHERKYVYLYGGLSLGLFLIGCVFCYYLVFPFVLRFLVSFNVDLGLTLQPRLSEWISFAIVLPVMFGLSFQLPLVMVFLERLQIVNVDVFVEQRRMAILIIAILSMVLTPADPISMLLMMFPLIGLYEVGILMIRNSPTRQETAESAAE
jgi:sec-independent protein translocase protein TatC